jgi:flagellar hook-associated protein 3 FlgL
MQRMTAIQTQMSQYTATLTNEKGVIEDANMAQVITQFNTDQISYQAALKMGSQILLPTLVSFLPSG